MTRIRRAPRSCPERRRRAARAAASRRKLAGGPPAAREARASTRRRPTSTSATRSSSRSCASSRTLGHHGRADHRRLHGARGRPERALGARGRCCRPEEIDANARDLPGAGASRCSTRERTEVRRNSEWLDMPMEELFRLRAHDDRRPAARARRLRQALRRAAQPISIARAALPAAAGLRLGGGRAPTSSSAGPTRSSTCCSAATSRRPTACRQQSILTMPILPGHRRRARR